MTKGIVLAAFGKRGYMYMAHNIALSIKHYNPNLKVALLHDDTIDHLGARTHIFDELIPLEDKDFKSNLSIDPALFKCNIGKHLSFDHNLYLDVDGIVLADLEPILDGFIAKEGYYYTYVLDKGKKDAEINYSVWATNAQIWECFGLGSEDEAVAIQSSFAYFQKSKEATKFYNKVSDNYQNFDKQYLTQTWGGTIPDELIYSGTISQMKLDASGDNFIFFGSDYLPQKTTLTDLHSEYALLSLYGNGNGRTLTKLMYWEYYDRLMKNISDDYAKSIGQQYPHIYKTGYFKKDKHANG